MNAVSIANIMFLVSLVAYAIVAVCAFRLAERDAPGLRRFAVAVACTGVAAQVVFMIEVVARLQRAPWGSLYEFIAVMSAIVMIVVALLLWPRGKFGAGFEIVAGSLAVIVSALMLIVRITAFSTPSELQPALQSSWLIIHVFMAVIGSALLLAAGVVSIVYLVKRSQENRAPAREVNEPQREFATVGAAASEPVAGGAALAGSGDSSGGGPVPVPGTDDIDVPGPRDDGKLAASERLDSLARSIVLVAFPIWTLALFLGAIWGEQAWGRYWGWDPKETVSFMIWAVFAAYLHARATATWRGQRAAILAIVGAGLVLFNLFGINFLISGLHSYSGG